MLGRTRLKSFGPTSSVTDGLGDATWLSKSSPELDDGGDDDIDVAQLVEDGVGESLPYEVDASGEFGPAPGDKRC
jgi:hypothetical protein